MIGVLLKSVRQLSAGQLLDVEIAVAIRVSLEFDLGKRRSR